MMTRRILLTPTFIFASLLSMAARAGVCTDSAGFTNIALDTVVEDTGKVIPGAKKWNVDGFPGSALCSCGGPAELEHYYTVTTPLRFGSHQVVNGQRRDFYQLGDGTLQIAIDVNGNIPVPSDNYKEWALSKCFAGDGTVQNIIPAGAYGTIHMLIAKPFVGKLTIPSVTIARISESINAPVPSGAPTTRTLGVSGSITVPQTCQLEPGQNLSIDFGRRIMDQVALPGQAGIGPVKRSFNIQCKNIKSGVNVDLFLEAQPQAKDKRYIATTHDNVGVAVESNGRLVVPTSPGARPVADQKLSIDLDYQAQRAQFDMSAYPVRMVERPSTGAYQGNATVKFEFQ